MNVTFTVGILAAMGGYIASIFTWPKIKVLVNGVEAEAKSLYAKADALAAKVKAKF